MFFQKGLLYITSFFILAATVHAQLPAAQQQAIVLKRLIERNHYSPRAVDDSFSSGMFSKFIDGLDPRRQFFTADDYARLSAYRYKLDDEIKGSGWAALDLATKIYRERLKRADTIINAVLQKPLDLSIDENISFSNETGFSFAPSATELNKLWTRWFKFLMLNILYDLGDSAHSEPLKSLLAKHETAVRQKIRSGESKDIYAILDYPSGFENYVKDIYLNALATSFDPHTEFFSPQEKENFQSQVSTEEYSFGFDVDEDGGKVVVAQLIPGGPAWKSGELNKNDELLQLQWEGQESVDVSMLTAGEAEDVLHQYNHGNITIKIRKGNGSTRTITLRKEKIETEEEVVKGYILKGEKKIGYILLPDFYTSWDDENGSGCANDVAKEIVKLKKENIEGLILDVRYNGGGSLGEALQMIGIFIDEGPLSGEKDRDGKLVFLKDPNRGTIYDGPMILMVNGQSASASETLAAALQDYNRAVLVGSPTYGKATMQQIFPMDTITSMRNIPSPNGFAKITLGKLYRVNGQTAQLTGVIPDINLPDAFDGLEYREKFSSNVLPADTVKKNAYYKPLPFLPVNELSALSRQRVSNNKSFREIEAAIKSETERAKAKTQLVPVKLEAFEKWIQQKENREEAMDEKEHEETRIFTAENHRLDKQALEKNPYSKEINEVMLKKLRQDIYIEEAYLIMSDLIRLQKSKTN